MMMMMMMMMMEQVFEGLCQHTRKHGGSFRKKGCHMELLYFLGKTYQFHFCLMGNRRWAEAEAKIFCTQEQVKTAEFPEKQEGFFEACVFTTSLLKETGCLQPQTSWSPDFFADFCEVRISLMDFWPIKKFPMSKGTSFRLMLHSVRIPKVPNTWRSNRVVLFFRASSLEGGACKVFFLGLLGLRPAKRYC